MQQSSGRAERIKDEVARAIAEKMVEKLAERGGVIEEKRFAVSFLRFGADPRRAALKLLAADGRVRKIRHASSGKNLVVLAGTDRQKARDELSYVLALETALEKERRREMKPTVEEFGVGQSFFHWAEEARAGRVRIEDLPFRASAEDLGIETKAERERRERNVARMRRDAIARRGRGEPLVVKGAQELDRERSARSEKTAHWTRYPELRARLEAQSKSGRAAFNTARAAYVNSLPSLAHKLLHLLRRDGAAPEEAFVDLARSESPEHPMPLLVLKAAASELAEAGKVKKARHRRSGKVYLKATSPLDGRAHRRDLSRIVNSAEAAIPAFATA
ncbi:hypothetical protein GBA65_22160 (plasmid) [Rubrobacter marinus]|uniref:Uncharacterized protein n=1 Tax=Rubrobacter marinus TaxID=2653852 RepID=A0A6G8Q3Y0_9ACTN|nr:hypothetical protein [Rubrobacter marinus]QIN81140.1 hypothetical protein GBA65_22160 [Rubrobacter marinus]